MIPKSAPRPSVALRRALASAVLVAALVGISIGLVPAPRPAWAEPDVRLRITTEGYTKIRIGFEEAKPGIESKLHAHYDRLLGVIEQDLDMSGYFEVVKARGSAEANAIVETSVRRSHDELSFEVRLGDKLSEATIFRRKYHSSPDEVAATAHLVAEEIIVALTGRQGIANTRVAFVAGERGNSYLYMVQLDGETPTRLTQAGGIVMSPSWSPDGARLAYVSYQTGMPAIYVMDASSLGATRFASFEGLNGMPAWSPDGRSLAVTLSKDGNPEIYVLSLDGTLQRRITFYSGIDCSPAWAPNGLQLAFTSDRAGTPQIFVTDTEGLGVRQVTSEGNYNTSPAWSPDGSLIAFVSRIDGEFQICTVDPFGVSVRVLTSSDNNEDPCWSADGMHLVFSSTGRGKSGIYIMGRDGGDKRKIVDGFTRPRNPAWSPPPSYGKQSLLESQPKGGN